MAGHSNDWVVVHKTDVWTLDMLEPRNAIISQKSCLAFTNYNTLSLITE